MEKKIYLHIGTPKTGSTTIHKFLAANAAALLKRSYTVYTPETGSYGRNDEGLRLLVNQVSSERQDGSLFRTPMEKFIQSVKNAKTDRIILSEEVLWNSTGCGQFHGLLAEFIAALTSVAEVRPVVYLRRQDCFLMSEYQEHLKCGNMNGLTCSQWIQLDKNLQSHCAVRYKERLQWLILQCGKQAVTVRPFEKAQFLEEDLLSDFLQCIGLSWSDEFIIPEKQSNRGLSPFLAEILRCLSFFYTGKDVFQSFLKLRTEDGERFFNLNRQHQFLSPCERREIMMNHEQGNRWVASELLDRQDGILFYEPLPLLNEPWEEYKLEADDVRGFFAEADCLDRVQRERMCKQVLSLLDSKFYKGRG